MNGFSRCFQAIVPIFLLCAASWAQDSDRFTPLEPLDTPTILAASESYPGGSYDVENMIDGRVLTEHSSASKGTETFIDFDLGAPVAVAGLWHTDRNDLATIKASQLVFSNTPDFDDPIATAVIEHVNTPGGQTRAVLPKPVTARYVRWQVTALGPRGFGTVGGAEIGFFTAGESGDLPTHDRITARGVAALLRGEGPPVRPMQITIEHPYAEEVDAVLRVTGLDPKPVHLRLGSQTVEVSLAAEDATARIEVALEVAGKVVAKNELTLDPVRQWEFSFLPHSHVDIGYTHVQTEVEQMQWEYLEMAIDIARRTADYPQGSQFHWNTETLWPVDGYLKQASDAEREAFFDAVDKEWIHLDALYGNELTALCRPEELMRLVDCARRISKEYDVTIDSAMISDVPGYTWGLVPALAQSGVKYLSIGPNHIHRIGRTLDAWGDKPFYWVSPSGDERVLCWMAGKAYSWFHPSRVNVLTSENNSPDPFFDYLAELEDADYPYDMVQVRYSIGGDNGPPDQQLCEFVKAWNAKYVWPRMKITTTSRLMHELEDRYGEQIPEVSGDFTPYWEDGAGSSAMETAMTRTAAERLVQAETLWSLLAPSDYPGDDFYSAWRDVLLYNEHTWGAHCSISKPDDPFTLSQWAIKQKFAVDAGEKSRELLNAMRTAVVQSEPRVVTAVDVYNTSSWPRSDLVRLDGPRLAGHRITDAAGQPVASQTFQSPRSDVGGGLEFIARDVPPLGAKRFFLSQGDPHAAGDAKVVGTSLTNGAIRVRVDEQTGAIAELAYQGVPVNLADSSNGGLNGYNYVTGRDRANVAANASVRVNPGGRSGPLEASLITVSEDAPGCKRLHRIIRVIDGLDRVDVINIVDKAKVLDAESVHFGFPFNVPNGVMRMDMPWAVVRPELDQLPGSCKNYFTVGRWVDVSNDSFGVTWATQDAPLVEVGGITVDVDRPLGSENWIEHIEPSQTLYSYVMNNYWETNYKASQEGVVVFRYSIRPHAEYDPVAAARFGVERSQPLVVMPADPDTPVVESRLLVDAPSVMVTSLKPSEDGKALVVRLFNVGDAPAAANVTWSEPRPTRVTRSGPGEASGEEVNGPIELPSMGIVTLRAEMP